MDERPPKPPLTNDPRFLADLSDLDQGLIDPTAEATSLPPRRLAPFPGESARRKLTPEASAALAAASEALAAFDASDDSSVSSALAFGRSAPSAAVDRKARDSASSAERGISTPAPSWRSRLLLIVLMIGLMLAGAAAAGWMFRGPLQRALARWHVVR